MIDNNVIFIMLTSTLI